MVASAAFAAALLENHDGKFDAPVSIDPDSRKEDYEYRPSGGRNVAIDANGPARERPAVPVMARRGSAGMDQDVEVVVTTASKAVSSALQVL
jgi:hypothetical protein